MKFATSIYDIVEILRCFSKPFGVVPLVRLKDLDKNKKLGLPRYLVTHILHVCVLVLIMTVTAVIRMQLELEQKAPSFYQYLVGAIFVASQLVNISKLMELTIRRKEFLKIIKLINVVDKSFDTIGEKVSYKNLHILLLAIIIFFPICLYVLISPAWTLIYKIREFGVWSKSSQKCVVEIVNLTIIYAILFTTFYMYNSIAFIMFKRLQSVNNYLVKNETENPYDSDSILKALKFTSKVHYKISLIAKNFDNTFGWGIFTTISLSFFIVVLSIVLRGKLSELHPAQSSCLNGILMISSVIVVIICQKIKIETQKIRCSICWLTLPNFNKQLSDIRCLVLYQLLQEPINLQATGFYPLEVTLITNHIGMLSTMLMFFLKLRSKLDTD